MAVDAAEPHPQPLPLPENRPSPWGRIAAVAGIAFDARKLILAAVGLLIFWAGNAVLREASRTFTTAANARIRAVIPSGPFETPAGPMPTPVTEKLTDQAEPALALMQPFVYLFATGPDAGTGSFFIALLASAWAAAVWGVFGGAIARVAAVQIASGGRIGIGTALRFAARKAPSLIGSPLCPLIAVGLFAALCGLFGLLYQIPGPVGATIAGALAFLPLLAGLVMALILAGMAAGWPLMIATVSTEGEDAFDALSRSYAYVFQRPARYAAYVLWAWLVGVIGLLVVSGFARAVPHLAEWGLAFGAPDDRLNHIFRGPFSPKEGPVRATHDFWLGAVALIARSWVYAYFWTAATQIYLLLRRDVDGTPLGDVYLPEHDADTFAPDLADAKKPEAAGDFAGVPPGEKDVPVVPEI